MISLRCGAVARRSVPGLVLTFYLVGAGGSPAPGMPPTPAVARYASAAGDSGFAHGPRTGATQAFRQGEEGSGQAPLAFGKLPVGTRSYPQAIHLQNTGTTVLQFNTIRVTPNFAETDTCRPSVPVGGQCAINVTFDPTTAGPLTGTLTVETNAASPPYVIQLTGTGTVAPPSVSPTSLSFGEQKVGAASTPQAVTVTNNNAVTFNVTHVGAPEGWTESNDCQPSVAPHASCQIKVSFEPDASGQATGALTITDYASDSPQLVTLNGFGSGPVLKVSTSSLNFGTQSVSTTSSSQSVTLSNDGNATQNNLNIVTRGDFAQTNNCGRSLEAGRNCTIDVTFTPKASGDRSGTLAFIAGSLDVRDNVSLSGTGSGGGTLWLSTTSLTFPNQQVGKPGPTPQITLQNVTRQPLTISRISLGGTDAGDFGLSQNCGGALAAEASCQITLRFSPSGAGPRTATVSIVDSAADSPQTITLSGTGVAP